MKKKILVIGSGLAGTLICNEMIKHADVTLLEIGCKNAIQYPKIGFDKKKLAEVSTFCYGGGGTTNLWHNGLIPIQRGDITNQEFSGMLAESQSFRDEAASTLFMKSEPYSVAYERTISEMTGLAEKAGVLSDGVDCLVYPKKYSKLTVDRKVDDHYSVTDIKFVFEDRRIKTVNYTVGSKEYSVDVDFVIVSAGAMGSPRILKDILHGLGLRHESPGTGFIDHPTGFVGKVRFNKDIAELIKKLSLLDKDGYLCRSAIRLKSACGKITCCAFFRPAMTMQNRLSVYKYKSLLGASAGAARFRNAISWKLFHPDIVAEVYSHLFGLNIPTRTYNILFIAEQKRGNNRVYYDGNNLRVDWTISEEELAIYRSVLRKLKEILLNIAEEVNIETEITPDWLWSCAHHSCTTSLGSAPEDLVDRDLKLKATDNVYVCDGSVIQEHSYANTGLTIAELAFRLTKKLLDVQLT